MFRGCRSADGWRDGQRWRRRWGHALGSHDNCRSYDHDHRSYDDDHRSCDDYDGHDGNSQYHHRALP